MEALAQSFWLSNCRPKKRQFCSVKKKLNIFIKVAIKKMKKKFNNSDKCVQLREVNALRKLQHVNIIKLKEVIKENEELFIVFEFMEGNLFQLMEQVKQRSGFTDSEVINLSRQMLQGLAYMHQSSLMDMKPENILIQRMPSAAENTEIVLKIADFGLAREIKSEPPYTDYVSTRWYRAPELLLRSVNYTSAIDIWAVGAIIYEIYTLSPIFPGTSEMDQIYKICGVLGVPNIKRNDKNEWKDGFVLAEKMSFKFPVVITTPQEKLSTRISQIGTEFLKEIFKWDPLKRPSAASLLGHSFLKDINDGSIQTTERKSVARNSLTVNTNRQARLSVGSTISDIGSIPTVSPLSSLLPGENFDWNPAVNREQVSFQAPSRARLSLKNDNLEPVPQRRVLENVPSVAKYPITVYDNNLSDLVDTTKKLHPMDFPSSFNDIVPPFLRRQSDVSIPPAGIVKNLNNNSRTVYDIDLNDEVPKQSLKEAQKDFQTEPTFLRKFQPRERQDSILLGNDDIISDFIVAPAVTKNARTSNPTWLSSGYEQRSNEKMRNELVNHNSLKQEGQDEIIDFQLSTQPDGFQPKRYNLPTWLQSKGSS